MVDFSSLVNVQADTIERPKPLPVGSYQAVISKQEFGTTNSDKKTPYCRYLISPRTALDDVDQDALSKVDLSKITLRQDFWLTPDSTYRLVEFLKKTLGLDTTGRNLGDLIPEAVGMSVLINVKHTLDRNNEPRAELNSIASV